MPKFFEASVQECEMEFCAFSEEPHYIVFSSLPEGVPGGGGGGVGIGEFLDKGTAERVAEGERRRPLAIREGSRVLVRNFEGAEAYRGTVLAVTERGNGVLAFDIDATTEGLEVMERVPGSIVELTE